MTACADKISARTRLLAARGLLGTVAAAMLAGGASLATPRAAARVPVSPQPLPAAPASPALAAPAKRPNIVLILADDMGFSDISSYGGEIPTPNIDALARDGLRFTQFYNCARCSPSRASLITGLYPHEAGMGHLENVVKPGSKGTYGKILDRAVTIADVLGSAGYYTGMAGKWHMGISHGVGPWNTGFQHSVAAKTGLYFPDQKGQGNVWIDGREVPTGSPEVGKGEWYASDLWVDWDTKYVQQAKAEKKPFFLYLPFTAVHWPLMAPKESIAEWKGKYENGYAALREARLARQKAMGIVGPDETLPAPLPFAYDWSKLTPAQRDRFDTMMAIYAADITRMDRAIGTLVARLKAAGEYDNTLILFMSDNGGNAEGGPDGKFEGSDPGGPQSRVWAGLNWATLMNTPFQYFKHYTEEGGIATPLIVHWPAGIDPKLNGSLVRAPGHLIDVMPTLAEVGGATYPKTFNGHAILPEEGRSMVPAFHGQTLTRDKPIFWAHEGNRAVRDGDWKLVARFEEPWELYNMSRDRSETHDLAKANPQIVARMSAEWDHWAAVSFVDPWDKKLNGGATAGSLPAGNVAPKRPAPAGERGQRRQKEPEAEE